MSALAGFFDFAGRRTTMGVEVRAGLTTFMVMAYIIFVNPIILGYVGVAGLEGKGLPFSATLTVTCLTAGLLSIAMGLASNYPFALAPGMGLNAVVAFELVAGRGLNWPQAMTVVFLEGVVITILVMTRFRQAVMDAVPFALKQAISVGSEEQSPSSRSGVRASHSDREDSPVVPASRRGHRRSGISDSHLRPLLAAAHRRAS